MDLSVIKGLRKSKGITQKELAIKVNTTPQYISNIENNRVMPSLYLLCNIIKAMDYELGLFVCKRVL